MTDVRTIASSIQPSGDGYWVSGPAAAVSYSESDSDLCFSVEEGSFWFAHRNRAILALLGAFPPPAGVILDVGGGNGSVTKAMEGAGYDAVLLEPHRTGARNAVARGVRHVIRGDVESAGVIDGSLAAAGLFDVVEHIENDVSFLRELRVKLQPGGRLYLTVPAFSMLWSEDDVSAGHYRRYRAATLAETLVKAGLRVDYTGYLFTFLPIPVLLVRTLPSLLHRRQVTPEAIRGEHAFRSRPARILNVLLAPELALIRRGRRIPFGSTCLAVATRV